LKDFLTDHQLGGWVVVSDIGKDGNIGQMAIRDLVGQVYKLGEINKRYREFLEKTKKEKPDPLSLSFSYLSILKDDPQLPFSFLPKNWLGEMAYLAFKSLPKSVG
jgi:DNA-binding transcriptional regulator PaaX